MTDKERIVALEKCLVPFAKVSRQFAEDDDGYEVLATVFGSVTVDDFRKAAEALRQTVAAGSIAPTY